MVMKFLKNFKKIYKYAYGSRKYILLYLIISIFCSIIGIIIPFFTSLQLVNLTGEIWDKVIIYSLFVLGIEMFDAILSFVSNFATQSFLK